MFQRFDLFWGFVGGLTGHDGGVVSEQWMVVSGRWIEKSPQSQVANRPLRELNIGLFFNGFEGADGNDFFTVNGHDGGASGFCVEEFEVRTRLGNFNKSSGFELFDDLLGCQAWRFGCHSNTFTALVQRLL